MEGNGGKQMVFPLRYCGMSILTSYKTTCVLSADVEKQTGLQTQCGVKSADLDKIINCGKIILF